MFLQKKLSSFLIFIAIFLLFFSFYSPLRENLLSFVSHYKNLNFTFWNQWLKTRSFLMFFYILMGLFFYFIAKHKTNIFHYKPFPFLFYFFILFIYHFLMPFVGDDLTFQHSLNNQNILNWITQRYQNWSGRIAIEFLIPILPRLPYFVFKIFNIFIWGIVLFSFCFILNVQTQKERTLLVILLLFFPFWQLNSAGWIATALNYLWPMAGILYVFYFYLNLNFKKSFFSFLQYSLLFVLLFISASQEQANLILLSLSFIFLIHHFIKHNFNFKKHSFLIFVFLFSLLMLWIILKSPGNHLRYAFSLQAYPAFENFHFLQKIWLGCVPTMGILYNEKWILLLLSFSIFFLSLKENNNKNIKILSVILLSLSFLLCVFLNTFHVFIPNFIIPFKEWNLIPTFSFYFVLSFLISLVHLGILLYFIFHFLNPFWAFVFVLGFFSRFIMGFSPTIYVSAERTALFFYFSCIAINFLMFKQLVLNKKHFIFLSALMSFVILFHLDRIQQSLWFNFNWLDIEFFAFVFSFIFFIFILKGKQKC